MAVIGEAVLRVRPDTDNFESEVTNKVGGAFKRAAAVAAGAFAAAQVGNFLRSTISAASDLNETISKSDTIFGSAGGQIEKWAEGAAESIGQSKQQALDAASTFGNLFTQLGLGQGEAARMSTAMVGLASDFASFHNADVSEVLAAQTAAFRGEYDAVQRFVPTINAATVEQKALQQTGKALAKELTQQEKALATQTLLFDGAGKAAGDFARTSDSLANKQRTTAAEFENVKTKLGTSLLPIMTKLTGVVSDVIGWFTKLPSGVQAAGVALAALGAAAAILAPVIASFATILPAIGAALAAISLPVVAVVAGIAALAAGVIYAYNHFEGFRNVVQAVARFFADTLPAVLTDVATVLRNIVGGAVEFLGAAWENFGGVVRGVVGPVMDYIVRSIENGLTVVRNIVGFFINVFTGDWSGAWESIKNIVGAVWDQIQNIISLAIGIVRGVITGWLDILGNLFRIAWDAALAVIRSSWEAIKSAVADGIEAVLSFFRGLPGKIVGAIGDLAGTMLRLGQEAMESLGRGLSSLIGKLTSIAGDIKDKIVSKLNPANWFSTPEEHYRKLWGAAFLSIADEANRGLPAIQSAMGNLIQTVADTGEAVFVDPLTGFEVGSAMSGVGEAIQRYLAFSITEGDWLNDWLTHIPEDIRSLVAQAGADLAFLSGHAPGLEEQFHTQRLGLQSPYAAGRSIVVNVNEVASDPEATAWAVANSLGLAGIR